MARDAHGTFCSVMCQSYAFWSCFRVALDTFGFGLGAWYTPRFVVDYTWYRWYSPRLYRGECLSQVPGILLELFVDYAWYTPRSVVDYMPDILGQVRGILLEYSCGMLGIWGRCLDESHLLTRRKYKTYQYGNNLLPVLSRSGTNWKGVVAVFINKFEDYG